MYTYGPVPSRRLGKSIGVSPIPSKTCDYSCVYCQLGRTNNFTAKRQSFFDKQQIIKELSARIQDSDADYITFVGDGEPTLNSDLGWLINRCRERFNIPIAVITNGSLLFQKKVQEELHNADLVMPSIDAGCQKTFRKINRPHKDLYFQEIINGIIDFSMSFKGTVWTETMLVKDYNDNEHEINKINQIIKEIAPEKAFIMCPTRPPAEDVYPPEPESYIYAQKIISGSKAITNIEQGLFNTSKYQDVEQALIEISQRHPLRKKQAEWIAEQFDQREKLTELINSGVFIEKEYSNQKYILPKEVFKRE